MVRLLWCLFNTYIQLSVFTCLSWYCCRLPRYFTHLFINNYRYSWHVRSILHLLSYLLNDWIFLMLRISYVWTEVFQSFSIPSFSPLIGLYFNSSKIKVEFHLPTAGYDCVLLHLASHLSWNCILTLQSAKIFIMFAQGFN